MPVEKYGCRKTWNGTAENGQGRREGSNMKPEIAARVATLSEAQREEFEERAAIMEFDGGLSRDGAEIEALADVLRRWSELANAQEI